MVYDTRAELEKLGEIDPELDALLKKLNLPPMDYSELGPFKDMAATRMAEGIKAMGSPPPGVKKSEIHYTTSDGTKNRVLLFQPESPPKDGSPLICLYHGGGFCVGMPESEEQSCRSFVQALGATCLSFSYRLAPDFKFPYAVTDAWDGLQFAAKNASSWGADPSKGFIVGGTSAGGNISAVLTHLARDEGLTPPLTGQWLSIPATVDQKRMPDKYKDLYISVEQNAHAPILPQAAIEMMMRGYEPDIDDSRFSVMLHPKGHSNLPSAYFQICGMDSLRDEALIYERILRQDAGIKTKIDMYPGLPHGFWGFFPMLSTSNKFREDSVKGVSWLLGRDADLQQADTDAKKTTGY